MTPVQKATVEALTRQCAICHAPLEGKRAVDHRFKNCVFCRDKKWKEYQIAPNKIHVGPGLSAGTVGAIHELTVAADLMKMGFMVFRAMSPSCGCDLVVLIGAQLLRVEVTTAYQSKSGKITVIQHNAQKYDILAGVHDGGIEYRPPMIEWPR